MAILKAARDSGHRHASSDLTNVAPIGCPQIRRPPDSLATIGSGISKSVLAIAKTAYPAETSVRVLTHKIDLLPADMTAPRERAEIPGAPRRTPVGPGEALARFLETLKFYLQDPRGAPAPRAARGDARWQSQRICQSSRRARRGS